MKKVQYFLAVIFLSYSFNSASAKNHPSNQKEDLVIEFLKQGKYDDAYDVSKKFFSKQIQKYVFTRRFFSSNFRDFKTIVNFIKNNPSWPENNILKNKLELIANVQSNPKDVYDWFIQNSPNTPNGHFQLYKASLKFEKDRSKLLKFIRNAWINCDFNYDETKFLLDNFYHDLDEKSHVEKIDHLLWNKKIDDARNFLPLVSSDYKVIYKAWISIIEKNHKLEEFRFHNIMGKFKYHSGLLHDYLQLHIKNKPNEELIRLYKNSPIDKKNASKWWKIRNYFVRELIHEKDFKNAYEIVIRHGLSDPSELAEAEWIAGWIALRYLNNPQKSLVHFQNLYNVSKSPISKSRGAYWIGRSYDKLNDKNSATKWYSNASNYGFTFYGQLAQSELGYEGLKIKQISSYSKKDIDNLKNNPFYQISFFLSKVYKLSGNLEKLKLFTKSTITASQSDGEVLLMMNNLSKNLSIPISLDIAKIGLFHNFFLKDFSYPNPYKFDNSSIPSYVKNAIIRQESLFDKSAVSSANAYGLMQLIPDTAQFVTKKLGISYNKVNLTTNPLYNSKLGSFYFNYLSENFNGSYIMAIAAYNAGPKKPLDWVQDFDDPRKMTLYQIIDWLELIPYYETRNYVQRVMENIQVYRFVENPKNKLLIREYLMKKNL